MQATQKVTKEEIENTLAHFTGTEAYHRFSPLSKLMLTDGVKYLCDIAQSYWLLDIITSYQARCNKDSMLRDFQVWTLRKAGNWPLTYIDNETGEVKDHPLAKKFKALSGNKAVVYCERDTNDVFLSQDIPYTDFPLDEIKLYCNNGVILLPSEY